MEWFRCYSEFATDSKVQIMPETMQRRLIMLFCLRSSDILETLHETEIAFALRITESELTETKTLFIQKGFIDHGWNIQNWNKRQYISDTSTARSRKCRERKKQSMQQACNVAATPPDQIRTYQNIKDQKDLLILDSDFDVDKFLTPLGKQRARAAAPLWGMDFLINKFNDFILDGNKIPQKPEAAFIAWCKTFTKGKSP